MKFSKFIEQIDFLKLTPVDDEEESKAREESSQEQSDEDEQ